MNHRLLLTFVGSITWKDYDINQKMFQCHLKYYNLHHRLLVAWAWVSDENNTCTHTLNSKLVLRDDSLLCIHFLFSSICAASNLSTKIYERSLVLSEKNLRVFCSWNRSRNLKTWLRNSLISISIRFKLLTFSSWTCSDLWSSWNSQLLFHEDFKWILKFEEWIRTRKRGRTNLLSKERCHKELLKILAKTLNLLAF
jgi:hypothetical protein